MLVHAGTWVWVSCLAQHCQVCRAQKISQTVLIFWGNKVAKIWVRACTTIQGMVQTLRKRQLWYICTRFLGPLSRSNCHLLNMVVFLPERRLFLGSDHYNHSTWCWCFLLLTFPCGIFPFYFTFYSSYWCLVKISFCTVVFTICWVPGSL